MFAQAGVKPEKKPILGAFAKSVQKTQTNRDGSLATLVGDETADGVELSENEAAAVEAAAGGVDLLFEGGPGVARKSLETSRGRARTSRMIPRKGISKRTRRGVGSGSAAGPGDTRKAITGGVPQSSDAGHMSMQSSRWFLYLHEDLGIAEHWVTSLHEWLSDLLSVSVVHDLLWSPKDQDWFLDLQNWPIFAVESKILLEQARGNEEDEQLTALAGLLVYEIGVIVSNNRELAVDVSTSDAKAITNLKAAGWTFGIGQVWGENDCLLDSLLQLLIACGFLPQMELRLREKWCKECRVHFCGSEGLHPRSRTGMKDPHAFLQHHLHANAAVAFFMSKCGALKNLPACGLNLEVHARLPHLCDQVRLCVTEDDPEAIASVFNVYCKSGGGLSGYHYDPMFMVSQAQIL